MSSYRAHVYHRVDAVLRDAYSVTLASEDGTYGVKQDNGTVIVPAGTSVTNPETGFYRTNYFDVVEGPVYQVAWKIITESGDEPKYVTQQVGPFDSGEPIRGV